MLRNLGDGILILSETTFGGMFNYIQVGCTKGFWVHFLRNCDQSLEQFERLFRHLGKFRQHSAFPSQLSQFLKTSRKEKVEYFLLQVNSYFHVYVSAWPTWPLQKSIPAHLVFPLCHLDLVLDNDQHPSFNIIIKTATINTKKRIEEHC